MCGIVGYIGTRDAVPLLLDGLSRLEYRGYDSAGIALHNPEAIGVRRSIGRLANLEKQLKTEPLGGSLGIGHTRWATHGAPSVTNCHPHADSHQKIQVVHNGIIENYQELKQELIEKGHTFLSETDTEIIPHLIEQELSNGAADFGAAVRAALKQARGAYALGVIHQDDPDTLYAARLGSPLIVGLGSEENFIASDVPAIITQISQVIYLDDEEIAIITRDGVILQDLDGQEIPADIQDITIEAEAADRGGFETFMMKEIHEQPRVLRGLIEEHVSPYMRVKMPLFDSAGDQAYLKNLNRIILVSCGTAYYAGLYGKMALEHFTSIPAEIEVGSEFRYSGPRIQSNTLIIAVSQSGETADTLASVRLAKEMGCRLLSVCNSPGSSLVRESDYVMYTNCGPEIGVASTKAYTAQLLSFALLSLYIAEQRGDLSEEEGAELLKELCAVPDMIHKVLARKEKIQPISEKHHDGPSALYLGRRFNYPTALEGALKNKEISYQHAEGYAAGEMKHGPIALISEYMPVICICTKTADEVYEKMISNMKEVEARSGRLIAIANDGDAVIKGFAEDVIEVPETIEAFSPIVNVVALQLLAYYAAQARGTDIDKPRNLAKSVTVE